MKYGVNINEFSLIKQSSSNLEGNQKFLKITPFELAFQYKNFRVINLLLENKAKAQGMPVYDLRNMSINWAVNEDFRGIAKQIPQDPDQICNANFVGLLHSALFL